MDFPIIKTSSFYGKQFSRLPAALEDISGSTASHADIVIIPPDVDSQTDEEHFEEDYMESTSMPNDVPGQVEVYYSDSSTESCHGVNSEGESENDSESEIPIATLRDRLLKNLAPPSKKRKITKPEPKWTNNTIDISMPETNDYFDRRESMKNALKDMNPVEIFEKLLDNEVIQLIVDETKRYADQNNNHDFRVSQEDIKIFIGILYLTGYHRLPRERLYWSLDEDVQVPLVAKAMSRNRFEELKRFMHLADNTKLNKQDKLSKVRPLMNLLNKKFLQWGIFHQSLSIDEAMVKYFGHHSAKQFIRGKPIRFGYKNWLLCSSSGYCYGFDTYCGAKPSQSTDQPTASSDLPLGSRVVLDLLQKLEKPSDHIVFFDNYFTSYDLISTLRETGVRATGTVRDNRIKKCPLLSVKEMKKKDRGYFEQKYDEKKHYFLFDGRTTT